MINRLGTKFECVICNMAQCDGRKVPFDINEYRKKLAINNCYKVIGV